MGALDTRFPLARAFGGWGGGGRLCARARARVRARMFVSTLSTLGPQVIHMGQLSTGCPQVVHKPGLSTIHPQSVHTLVG